MMMPLLYISTFLLFLSSCSQVVGDKVHPEINNYFDQNWANKNYWDDGKAEVAKYAAEQSIYGKVRNFEYVYMLVKEDFNKEFNVKTDNYNRSDLFNIMKVNQFCRIETDNYPYHFLSSFFYIRENPLHLHKATISSQEWCGNTFKVFHNYDTGFIYHFNSYWDGQGEGSFELGKEVLFEDQLSYSLRALKFKEGLIFNYEIVESQITNQATKPKIYNATISVNTASTRENVWKVEVALDNEKLNEYSFEKSYPNVLVKQQTWDGRNMKLLSVERNEYWKKDDLP